MPAAVRYKGNAFCVSLIVVQAVTQRDAAACGCAGSAWMGSSVGIGTLRAVAAALVINDFVRCVKCEGSGGG